MSTQIFKTRLDLALFHGFHYGFMLCAKYQAPEQLLPKQIRFIVYSSRYR